MARQNVLIERPVQEVWEVLADGDSYAQWVIGTSETREERGTWPRPGASVAWSARLDPPGPLARVLPAVSYGNRTVVRVCRPPHRLELEARAGRLGTARIALEVREWGPGSALVTVDEHPLTGPGARGHGVLLDLAMQSRLRRMLDRLSALVRERR